MRNQNLRKARAGKKVCLGGKKDMGREKGGEDRPTENGIACGETR